MSKNPPRCQVCSENFKKGEVICISVEGTRHHTDCDPKLKKPSKRLRDISYTKRLEQSKTHTAETHIGIHNGQLSSSLNKRRKYVSIDERGHLIIFWATSLTEAKEKAKAWNPKKVMELGQWQKGG